MSPPQPAPTRRTIRSSNCARLFPLADTHDLRYGATRDFPQRFYLTCRCVGGSRRSQGLVEMRREASKRKPSIARQPHLAWLGSAGGRTARQASGERCPTILAAALRLDRPQRMSFERGHVQRSLPVKSQLLSRHPHAGIAICAPAWTWLVSLDPNGSNSAPTNGGLGRRSCSR